MTVLLDRGVALVGIGSAGIVFPALPGTILIFAGLLTAAWAVDFARVGPWTLLVIGLIGGHQRRHRFRRGAVLGARHAGASPRLVNRRAAAGNSENFVEGFYCAGVRWQE